jgi:hypothetical protein
MSCASQVQGVAISDFKHKGEERLSRRQAAERLVEVLALRSLAMQRDISPPPWNARRARPAVDRNQDFVRDANC